MSPANHPDQRGSVNDETLSALFDGQLEGDAARFALRRLEHDAGWRETCGRWQLAGDQAREFMSGERVHACLETKIRSTKMQGVTMPSGSSSPASCTSSTSTATTSAAVAITTE